MQGKRNKHLMPFFVQIISTYCVINYLIVIYCDMKANLEQINLDFAQSSIKHFLYEDDAFKPYWHFHPQSELTFIKRGNGFRFVGDNIDRFEDGDLVLIGPFTPHQWVSQRDNNKGVQAFVTQFHLSTYANLSEFDELKSFFHKASKGIRFINAGDEHLSAIQDMRDLDPITRFCRFTELLFLLSKLDYKTLSKSDYKVHSGFDKIHKRINKVTTFILNHFEEPLSVNTLSTYTNMTQTSFSRWFKSTMGIPFNHYLNEIRIQRANQLLVQTDYPISEIAFQCGFETLSTFTRNFKKFTGRSARDYRKEILSN